MNSEPEEFIESLIEEVKKDIVIEGNFASIVDPVFHIRRNRVNAEFCKTLIRLKRDPVLVNKLLNTLVNTQNPDGSWNEIHPNYNQPSALITAFIGEALLLGDHEEMQRMQSLENAKNYVLSQEKKPGYFLKSAHYNADHLNVDASCGAFLALYGKSFSDTACLDAARRAAERICSNQINGAYPYATDKGNYPYPFSIPCIHYQGVTMYYLIKIQQVLNEPWIHQSLMDAAHWLANVQRSDGKFDWSKSGLMFAYHLSGAYAFAYSAFSYVAKFERKYEPHASLCRDQIIRNTRYLVLRWESDPWYTILWSPIPVIQTAGLGKFPLKEKVFRYGYGMYREVARRRYSDHVDDRFFSLLCTIMRISPSTVDPLNNYKDIFMTSEVLDCLSYSLGMDEEYAV